MSIREWIVRLFAVGRRGSRDRELQDELRFHLQALIAAHERAGLSSADARAKAMRELGGIDRTTQAWRDQRAWLPAEELRQDVTFGWRVLRRSPSFTLPAVLTMAMAVAAATSVFTVVDAVLLAPLPYGDPGQVITIFETLATQKGGDVAVAPGNFLQWQARARTLEAMTAIDTRQQNLTRDGDPQQVHVTAVSSGFAPTIAVQPEVGRLFAPDEFEVGRDAVAILSHSLWRARYQGDPDVVGRTIVLDDARYTVVGVMPARFAFPSPGSDVWVPLAFTGADRDNRSAHSLSAMARLRHGIDIDAARREMDAIAEAMATESPAWNRDWGIRLRPAREAVVGDTKPVLAAVAIAVALLLLVACANVAGLLLTQGLSRDREIAIRIAIGAARARIIRQILCESVLLSLAGGSLGLVLAHLAGPLVGLLRPDDFVAWKDIGVDLRAGAFAIGVSIVVGALFGLLPAMVLSDRGLEQRTSRRTAGTMESRARLALIGGEVALAVVLVCGAAVFARTLDQLTTVDIGFRPSSLVTMQVSLPAARYGQDHQIDSFFERTLERIRVLPGVRAAGATHVLPLGGDSPVRALRIEGQSVSNPRDLPLAHYRMVTAGYLEAMGIPLRAGRTFTASDISGQPLAVIVNEALQRLAWGTRDPLGARVTIWGPSGAMAEVVGVVADVRHFGPSAPAPPEIYWPVAQVGAIPGEAIKRARRSLSLVISTAGDPLTVVPSVRTVVQEVDADQPIASVRTMTSLVGSALWLSRASAWIVSTFGAAAFVFALLGVFGAVSYSVAQRRQEIAVRLALGATRSGVRRLVLRSTVVAAAIGVVAGLVAIPALQRGFAWLIVDALPLDAATLVAVVAGSTALVLLACWLPARRASNVEPMRVLRSE